MKFIVLKMVTWSYLLKGHEAPELDWLPYENKWVVSVEDSKRSVSNICDAAMSGMGLEDMETYTYHEGNLDVEEE